jgi:hypothetical protein
MLGRHRLHFVEQRSNEIVRRPELGLVDFVFVFEAWNVFPSIHGGEILVSQ